MTSAWNNDYTLLKGRRRRREVRRLFVSVLATVLTAGGAYRISSSCIAHLEFAICVLLFCKTSSVRYYIIDVR
jgi:hypothetical protein